MTDYALPPTPEGVDELAWRAAVSGVRSYCHWHISPSVTETVTVDGPGDGILLLPTLYLTALTAVTNDGVLIEDAATLQWSTRGAVRRDCRNWTSKYRGVVVTMTHGYDEFPAELSAVAQSMAAYGIGAIAKKLVSGPHSVDFGDSAQAGAAVPHPLHIQILDRYRIPGRL